MKMRFTFFVLRLVMIACFSLASPSLTAQTFTNLHSFSATPFPYTNIDGVSPEAAFISSGNTLFGTAADGGSLAGTLIAVNVDGTGFTNLHNFAPAAGFPMTNGDGATPVASLCLLGDTLYGVTSLGTTNGNGNIFKIGTNGSGFAVLHTFTITSGPNLTNRDGARPRGGLVASGQTLYGTAGSGGGSGLGTVFKMDTDGSNFGTLHTFTNRDGAMPLGDLLLSGDLLFGTTVSGGHFFQGSVFAMRTNGVAFTNLYSFPAAPGSPGTNSDGTSPHAGLILSGNTLYGTAFRGGSS